MIIDIAQQVTDLLENYPGLRLVPVIRGGVLRSISGNLSFDATDEQGENRIQESFQIEMQVPADFPRTPPVVTETGGRIPSEFHRFPYSGNLCLGSPLKLMIELDKRPSLLGFVESCVIPYFYGFVRHQQDGQMPFFELEHGDRGLLDEYRQLLEAPSDQACAQMLRLLSMKKRVANKHECPCGSGKRLGCCHHNKLKRFRGIAPRSWFKQVAEELSTYCEEPKV